MQVRMVDVGRTGEGDLGVAAHFGADEGAGDRDGEGSVVGAAVAAGRPGAESEGGWDADRQ